MKIKSNTLTWLAVIIGIIDTSYLSYVKLFHSPLYCTPGLGDCVTVNNSRWAILGGIPLATWGLATYLVFLFLLLFGDKIEFLKPYSVYLSFGLSLFAFLFSLYLTYIEFFVLHAVCQWCLLSAICIIVIFITNIVRLKDRNFQPN